MAVARQSRAEEGEHLLGSLFDLGFFPPLRGRLENGPEQTGLGAGVLADHHVLEDGHGGEEADVLEGPCHAQLQDLVGTESHDVLPVEDDRALVRRLHPRDQVEKGCLPGPIGPDDADYLALVDMQLQAVYGA